jgi:hypothetical protein
MEELSDLESYLRTAVILDAYTFPAGGAHPDKHVVILEGGVSVLAKPARSDESSRMATREVAAWSIARDLGWAELMGATVMRTIDQLAGNPYDASLQVLWPAPDPDCDWQRFSDEEILRAATFDAIIAHTDRGGHNWLGVPGEASGMQSRLKLVDHGYSLNMQGPGDAVASTFFEARRGQSLPEDVTDAISQLLDEWPPAEVDELLEPEAADATQERAQRLLAAGVLSLDEE